MRSRICARKADQLSALISDSNPAASNAHIVVNIASLPSTVTLIAGADRSRDVGCCAGAGGVACARTAIGANTHAHSPANIHRRIIFLTLLPQFPPGLAKTGETEHAALPAERMEGLAGPTY